VEGKFLSGAITEVKPFRKRKKKTPALNGDRDQGQRSRTVEGQSPSEYPCILQGSVTMTAERAADLGLVVPADIVHN
jgi:hypothetical protein